jgi:hypothetical protein
MIKLNIQRFGTTVTGNAYETGADSANNRSYVYATFTQVAASNTYNNSGSAYYNISCDGQSTGNVNFKFGKGSTKTFSATLGPYYHNADGSLGNKTCTIYVNGDVNNSTHTLNYTVSFTKFARGFSSKPTITLEAKDYNSFGFSWHTSENASQVFYTLMNSSGTIIGSETRIYNGGGSQNGSFSITGLSQNTTYKVRIRAVRADSGLDTNGTSDTGTYTTYIKPVITLSLTSRTETSLKIKATTTTTPASKTWYLNLNGQTVKTSTSTAETVEFTGLTANKTYQVVVNYTSTSAQGSLPADSAVANYATLQYPYVSAVGTSALQIGNSQTLTLSNPLGRSVTVYMKKDSTSGTQFYSGTTTGTSVTFTPNANTMYSSIPNSTTGNCVYYCVYNNQNVGTKSGTYVTKGTELPTFSTSNWSYTANLTELTNNNQVVIPSYSTVTFRLDTVASGKNSASISSYNVIWNDTVALGGTTAGTTKSITGKTSSSLSMVAKDTRGYQTTATKTLASGVTFIPYASPTVQSISTHRTDGIQTETKLDLSGKFYATTFGGTSGSHTNTLFSAKYYTKLSNSSTWSGPYDISLSNFTINTTNGTFSIDDFQIHANGQSGGFTVGTRYDIKVEIKDAKGLLGIATATSSITDGKIARDVYQDSNGEYHEGINGRANANYTEYINGNFKATGNIEGTGIVKCGAAAGGSSGSALTNGGIELYHSTPFIDFHFNNDSADWTSRIMEDVKGRLYVPNDFRIGKTLTYAGRTFSFFTLTGGNGNTTGWRLVTSFTATAWGNYRLCLLIQSRHQGVGILSVSISMGENNKTFSGTPDIRYYGAQTQFNNACWRLYFNNSTGLVSLYWYYSDYSPADVIVLCNQGFGTLSNGTWSTSIPSSAGTFVYNVKQNVPNIDAIYPVGSIYLSANNTSPASLFGGTWTQLKNRFLFATNDTSGAKGKDAMSTETGVAVTGTAISVNQMPSHNHGGNTGDAGSHSHSMPWVTTGWQRPGNSGSTYSVTGTSGTSYNTGDAGSHHHSITAQGGGQTHSHNVPRIHVYVWQRTA